MELPYLKVVLVVFACLSVHLVEPFYARTIEKDATHTQLREFYKGLHTGLGQPVSDNFPRSQQMAQRKERKRLDMLDV